MIDHLKMSGRRTIQAAVSGASATAAGIRAQSQAGNSRIQEQALASEDEYLIVNDAELTSAHGHSSEDMPRQIFAPSWLMCGGSPAIAQQIPLSLSQDHIEYVVGEISPFAHMAPQQSPEEEEACMMLRLGEQLAADPAVQRAIFNRASTTDSIRRLLVEGDIDNQQLDTNGIAEPPSSPSSSHLEHSRGNDDHNGVPSVEDFHASFQEAWLKYQTLSLQEKEQFQQRLRTEALSDVIGDPAEDSEEHTTGDVIGETVIGGAQEGIPVSPSHASQIPQSGVEYDAEGQAAQQQQHQTTEEPTADDQSNRSNHSSNHMTDRDSDTNNRLPPALGIAALIVISAAALCLAPNQSRAIFKRAKGLLKNFFTSCAVMSALICARRH